MAFGNSCTQQQLLRNGRRECREISTGPSSCFQPDFLEERRMAMDKKWPRQWTLIRSRGRLRLRQLMTAEELFRSDDLRCWEFRLV